MCVCVMFVHALVEGGEGEVSMFVDGFEGEGGDGIGEGNAVVECVSERELDQSVRQTTTPSLPHHTNIHM